MARFIELTAIDKTGTKITFNVEHIVSYTPEGFTGTCRIMVPGVIIEVQESYDVVKKLICPPILYAN